MSRAWHEMYNAIRHTSDPEELLTLVCSSLQRDNNKTELIRRADGRERSGKRQPAPRADGGFLQCPACSAYYIPTRLQSCTGLK